MTATAPRGGTPARVHPSYLLAGAALAALVATAIVGVALYPGIPATFPIHWNGLGQADGWAHKSVLSVFQILLIALAVQAVFFALSLLSPWVRSRVPSATPEEEETRAVRQRHLYVSTLGWLQLAIAVGMGLVSVGIWEHGRHPVVLTVGGIGSGVLVVAVIVVMMVRLSRSDRTPAGSGPGAAGTADHWKAGFLYVDRSDRAVFVPKRYGLGWTVNFGSAGGIAVAVLMLALIVAIPVVSALAGR